MDNEGPVYSRPGPYFRGARVFLAIYVIPSYIHISESLAVYALSTVVSTMMPVTRYLIKSA